MSNRLAAETSPYLRQHADNPVDWQPWDAEALAMARRRQQPILLSVGYSACHWCHVMAHESFEDPDVARVMNEHFVNVKVDREERPDLDRVYQLAHQLLTQQPGGWPLTMFLDPDTLVPFFGGTYFPRRPRHGLPGFSDLLTRVADVFESRRDELTAQGEKVAAVLGSLDAGHGEPEGRSGAELAQAARDALASQYDSTDGGFGTAPKFPMPATLDRLLRHWAASVRDGGRAGKPDRAALDMVMTTLTRMARGGIHDHLGGGFCRYATDRRWMIPHFEKMLYDNGQLLALYSDALGVAPDALFKLSVTGIADWLHREMRHEGGAFFAALDADSEGEEGRYYLWRRDEVKRLLDEDEYLLIETLYGLDKPANFEGRWILHRYDAWAGVVSRLALDQDQAERLWRSAVAKLLAARERRQRPALDDKVLTSWNALVIDGLARASVRLERPDWLESARAAADFLADQVLLDGRLFATWQAGRARHPAYLDDYAALLRATLTLLSAGWRDRDLRLARTLAEALLERFEDADAGGFFFTAHDHETLICRPKPTMDDAMAPGNALAAQGLADLGHLLGEQRYLEAASRTIDWARKAMETHPAGHCAMLTALEAVATPPEQIVIRGPRDDLGPWLAAAQAGYRPWRRVYAIPSDADPRCVPPYLPRLMSADASQRPVAYRCEGFQCSLPIESFEALEEIL